MADAGLQQVQGDINDFHYPGAVPAECADLDRAYAAYLRALRSSFLDEMGEMERVLAAAHLLVYNRNLPSAVDRLTTITQRCTRESDLAADAVDRSWQDTTRHQAGVPAEVQAFRVGRLGPASPSAR